MIIVKIQMYYNPSIIYFSVTFNIIVLIAIQNVTIIINCYCQHYFKYCVITIILLLLLLLLICYHICHYNLSFLNGADYCIRVETARTAHLHCCDCCPSKQSLDALQSPMDPVPHSIF